MRPQTYQVRLDEEATAQLLLLVRRGKAPARVIRRANVLLLASEGESDLVIAATLHMHVATAGRIRKRFCDAGLDAALYDRSRAGAQPKLDARAEAHLIALACSDPPDGRGIWTMQLLADRLVELQVVDSVSDETVRRQLKKNQLKPWQRQHWCTAKVGADFVSRMEDGWTSMNRAGIAGGSNS